jgi:stage II sporulation protein D
MKKTLLFSFLIVIIPYIIVNIFIRNDEIQFIYCTNQIVRVYLEDENKIVNVPLEEYIVGVLAGEMPANFNIEALKAQAVASRSYVLSKMSQNTDNIYDVINTKINQVYLTEEELKEKWQDNYVDNINKIKQAVIETAGEYLTYDGSIVEALFFSTSPGITENSEEVFKNEIPYLRSVSSSWDDISPAYNEEVTYTKEEFFNRLSLPFSDSVNIEITSQTSTGRIKELKINNQLFTSSKVVECLDLRSTFFTIKDNGDNIIITTKGYGHGVGMSQYGAEGMAENGYTYDQILKYYYTNVEITN